MTENIFVKDHCSEQMLWTFFVSFMTTVNVILILCDHLDYYILKNLLNNLLKFIRYIFQTGNITILVAVAA